MNERERKKNLKILEVTEIPSRKVGREGQILVHVLRLNF